MALRFLFDECVATSLVQTAHSRGFEAYHVAHRGLAGAKDHELLSLLIAEDLVLVTNNGPDFTALVEHGTVHPGLVVFVTQVRPRMQARLFAAALEHLGAREELINRVVEVDVNEATRRALTPNSRLSDEAWERLIAEVQPVIREFALPPEATSADG